MGVRQYKLEVVFATLIFLYNMIAREHEGEIGIYSYMGTPKICLNLDS